MHNRAGCETVEKECEKAAHFTFRENIAGESV